MDLAEFKSAVDDLRLRPLGVAADALARAVVEADPTFASRKPTR